MDSKKRRKFKKNEASNDETRANSFELEVCKYMYRKLPTKDGRLAGCLVRYFKASEAVDFLLKSPWNTPSSDKKDPKSLFFTSREVAIRFMEKILEKQLIARYLNVYSNLTYLNQGIKS